MAYIGNIPAEKYATLAKQTITGNGGASYTLDYAVANEQEIEVFVNNVRQEPGVAYTVSGTALTMTGNVTSTDDFYVVFQGKTVGTIVPGDDTITTAMLKDGVVTSAKVDSTVLTTASNSTALADVSTGTWNPYWSDINGNALFNVDPDVYASHYTKIGNTVIAGAYFRMPASFTTTAFYSSSSDLYIGGLPFSSDHDGVNDFYAGSVGWFKLTSWSSSYTPLVITESGRSVLRWQQADANGSNASIQLVATGSSSGAIINIIYKTAS